MDCRKFLEGYYMYTLYRYDTLNMMYNTEVAYFINLPDSKECGYIFCLPKEKVLDYIIRRYTPYHDLDEIKNSEKNSNLTVLGKFETKEALDVFLMELNNKIKISLELMK